ncbi:MAG: helix-turn-helix domain-containing protein [Candidatus Paceibacterota bacterium]|jgi:sugar-specific transcriptional regulator TrmB
MIEEVLRQFGLREKEMKIYLALLKLGPSSVRKISQDSGINRGTSYDVLRDLIKIGLVSYHEKKSHQYFIPEDPAKMISILEERKDEITKLKEDLKKTVDELQAEYCKITSKPYVRYYDGYAGAKEILNDVLKTVQKTEDREYYVYSTESIREYIYKSFKDFSKKRIEKNIHVKVLAIGKGGELRGKDERKWIENAGKNAPNYIIIYGNKVAFISVNSENEPMGIIIDDKATSGMQRVIFNSIWTGIK